MTATGGEWQAEAQVVAEATTTPAAPVAVIVLVNRTEF